MTDWAADQAAFMVAGGQTIDEMNHDQMKRYLIHIAEESQETYRDYMKGDMVKALDGAVDTIVVAIGFICSMGIDPNKAWAAVNAANMSKIGPDGKVYKRPDGQIAKPPNFVGPEAELAKLLQEAGIDG